MSRPSEAQLERARRVLAHEGGSSDSAEAEGAAAGRVFDKVHAHLAPLLGVAGVQALLVRSVKRAQGEPGAVAPGTAIVESATALREHLQALDPAVAARMAEALFGSFFTLLATFIGERLTSEMLRSMWPTIAPAAPTENQT